MPWNRALLTTCLLTGLAAAAAPIAATAAPDAAGTASFELFGSYLRRSSFAEEAAGVRAGYRFTDRWGVEGTLSYVDVNGDDGEVWQGDLSAKAYLKTGGRAEFFALAGPGGLRVVGFDDELTVHLGLGAEVALGERSYLRPEVRSRWFADDLEFDPILDYSLGFGIHF